MATLRAVMGMAVVATILIKFAMGANYTVGAPNGSWDLSTDLKTWATSQKFSVGDNLIFQYTSLHSVLEVSKADYDSCQTGTPIQSFMGGTTVILLSTSVKRYFICGTGGHCGQGMKVEIDTAAASTNPPPTSPSAPSPPSPSTPSPPTPSTPPPVKPPPSTPSPPAPSTPSPVKPPPSTPSPSSSPKKSPTSPSTDSPLMEPSESPSETDTPADKNTPSTNNGYLQVKPAMGLGFGILMLLALLTI